MSPTGHVATLERSDQHCDQLIQFQSNHWPMPFSRNNALHVAYMKIEQIIQKDYPLMTLEKTFHIPTPQLDAPHQPAQRQAQDHPPADQPPLTRLELALQAENMAHTLNQAQQEAYFNIIDSILNQRNKCFFIDGPGGTGKSYYFNEPSPPRGTQQPPTPRGRRPPLYPRGGGSSLWPQKRWKRADWAWGWVPHSILHKIFYSFPPFCYRLPHFATDSLLFATVYSRCRQKILSLRRSDVSNVGSANALPYKRSFSF